MKDIDTWVGIVTGLIALMGVVATVTRHFTRVQEQLERQRLEREKAALAATVASLQAREAGLREQVALSGRLGDAALALKSAIDERVQTLMRNLGASGASVYVPVRSPRGEVIGLAFLSMEPFTPQTQALKSKVIPLKSLAGHCFTRGTASAPRNASADPQHFKEGARLADYRPSTMLNLPIRRGEEVIAVLQLLSKEGERGFGEEDLPTVAGALEDLPAKIEQIVQSPDYLRVLGLAQEDRTVQASVLYFDLSGSSLLFEEASASLALQLLNDYFEAMCDVAFRHGGALDTYMGDGALVRFNVPRPVAEHELAAVRSALGMVAGFAALKTYWTQLNARFADMHFRAGIASGPLLRAELGHWQSQSHTIVGYPISVAASLCAVADRKRDVVLVADETWRAVSRGGFSGRPVAGALGKAMKFTNTAYEVTAIAGS
ncbi:MAG: GAF domain-containing protein [Alphaproteobacteria bacterium]|nr:GAF domain-containing protein [Alphaproteobacteria bacterium]MBV9371968.1 GAF domain-containing protein [Alphaproteobacteria bacterium]MBV9901951.1 GAF domain-containing protein [Alphaproteobacteria bacterium]